MTSLQQAGRLSSPRSWPVPAALVALSAIPLVAGTLRLGSGSAMAASLILGSTAIRRPHTAVALAGAAS